jgi:ribosome biogenesis GTPase / thiamine phosphate phosphatase
MTLEQLGFTEDLRNYQTEHNLSSFQIGRVASEHKERYIVKTDSCDFDAELVGNLRFTAESRFDFPAVGDWVAISEYDENKALIHAIYPRKSIIERRSVGSTGQKQIIATNVDFALVVQAVDRDFNINRLERYLTICHSSGIEAILILSKIDLIDGEQIVRLKKSIVERIRNTPLICLSNETQEGYTLLSNLIHAQKTYCLLGSSGVGKSTLLNKLTGTAKMKTAEISSSVGRGKHITSHRELILLDNGAILIDNPGMREVGIADAPSGIETTFVSIFELSEKCRYKDCKHIHEDGCAILEAIDRNEIHEDSYQNFLKMEKEKMHFESTVAEKKKKDKDLGKLIKNFKKNRKQKKN